MFTLLSSIQWMWMVFNGLQKASYFIWSDRLKCYKNLGHHRLSLCGKEQCERSSKFLLLSSTEERRNAIRVSKNMSELFLRELPSLFVFMFYSWFKPEVMVSREELIEGIVTCVFNCTSYQTAVLICTTGTAFCTYCSINLNTCFWDGACLRQVVRVCVCLNRELLSFESCFRAYSTSHCVRMWISEYHFA